MTALIPFPSLCRRLALLFLCLIPTFAQAQDGPEDLPLMFIEDLNFVGAFRLPADEFGVSSLNYAEGPIAFNARNQSLFIVGHNHHQAIAEFAIPAPGNFTDVARLPMAEDPLQVFSSVLGRVTDGNPQNIDRIGGMACFATEEGMSLFVNGYEYYDAAGDNTVTSAIIENGEALSTSEVRGFYTFDGGAGHTSGWLSPVPQAWQDVLGGTYLTGQSSGIPIISRTSVGPSAFAFDHAEVIGTAGDPGRITTTPLLDFNLENPLHEDLSNESGTNDLWTHLSRAVYGFVVPGTRSYLTLGYSGGHDSGVCYKCEQDTGTVCGGYCALEADDYAMYYWLWDVNEMLEARAGLRNAHEIRPYAYGPFAVPVSVDAKEIGGGAFDPDSGTLYLTLLEADRLQSEFANPPVVAVFEIDTEGIKVSTERVQPVPGLQLDAPFPNPIRSTAQLALTVSEGLGVTLTVHDALGRRRAVLHEGPLDAHRTYRFTLDPAGWTAGVYFIHMHSASGVQSMPFTYLP